MANELCGGPLIRVQGAQKADLAASMDQGLCGQRSGIHALSGVPANFSCFFRAELDFLL